MTPEQQAAQEYLGDGLYVSFDGYGFTLTAPREYGDHFIYLEPHVYQAFKGYAERTTQQKED